MLRLLYTCLFTTTLLVFSGCQKQVEEIPAKDESATGLQMSEEEKEKLRQGELQHQKKVAPKKTSKSDKTKTKKKG